MPRPRSPPSQRATFVHLQQQRFHRFPTEALRYEKLIGGGDTFSLLARVRLSAPVAFLFERAPKWTTANLLPLYISSSPEALTMWSARKYSNHIGSSCVGFGSRHINHRGACRCCPTTPAGNHLGVARARPESTAQSVAFAHQTIDTAQLWLRLLHRPCNLVYGS
jgi:hypothetical protein